MHERGIRPTSRKSHRGCLGTARVAPRVARSENDLLLQTHLQNNSPFRRVVQIHVNLRQNRVTYYELHEHRLYLAITKWILMLCLCNSNGYPRSKMRER